MNSKYILPIILVVDVIFLLFETSSLSISYNEAHILYGKHSVISYLSNIFIEFFGQNDYALRLPMIILHVLSITLLYKLSYKYIKQQIYRYFLIIVFILLPGVISSAIILNNAGIVIFLTLLYIYFFENKYFSYLALLVYFIIEPSFQYLFLSLSIFSLVKKDISFFTYNLFLFVLSIYIYGSDIGGAPTGHFLDALAVYSAIFTPIVFIYIVYSLYRKYLTKQLDIVWFISSVPFVFSLILSFRQRVHIELYAPYLLISILIAANIFISSYRVRLPQFRKKYKILLFFAVSFLCINLFVLIFNKYLYLFLDNPKKHFAYNNHIAKELALNLKEKGINCVKTDYKMQLRLKFYNIKECKKNILLKYKDTPNSIDVTVSYNEKPIYYAYVTKINNN
jgi:hypothetical protein